MALPATATVSGSAFQLQFSEFCVKINENDDSLPSVFCLLLFSPYSRVGAPNPTFSFRCKLLDPLKCSIMLRDLINLI